MNNNITFKLAYQFALHASSAGYAPSDQELRDEYELSQYYMRKNLGEPVIYQDGRCWYDGYVVSQGYWPGPFPGLEFWRSEKGPLNPEQFSQWLADTESERKQSKLPPVGWKGTPVCGVYAMDILKYYCNIGGVCGPETFKFAILKATGSMNR